jgi:hypothetical protein
MSNALKIVQKPLRELARAAEAIDLTAVYRILADQSGIGIQSVQHLMPWGAKFLVHHGGRVFVTVGESSLAKYGGRLAESMAADAVRKFVKSDARSPEFDRAYRRNTCAWWAAQMVAKP